MVVLAFDQSTNKSGYSVYNNGKLIDYGLIDKHKIKNSYNRLVQMGLAISHKIAEIKPDAVVAEDVFDQKNRITLVVLARLQGMIMYACTMDNIQLHIFSPSSWRKLLGFKQGGNVKRADLKQQAIDYVQHHFGLELSEDVAEAVCIGKAASSAIDF